jgi:hypothetical protein
MQFVQLLSLVMVGMFAFAAQKQTPAVNPPAMDDRYSVSTVSSALQYLQQQNHADFSSFADKNYLWPLLPLGDRVSIAVLRIYTTDELVRPENAGAYLTVARNAFSMRSSVIEKSDADPRVTLFLLAYLKEKEISNLGIEKRIEYLEGCVKDFTCSSQGEYDFFHKS